MCPFVDFHTAKQEAPPSVPPAARGGDNRKRRIYPDRERGDYDRLPSSLLVRGEIQ